MEAVVWRGNHIDDSDGVGVTQEYMITGLMNGQKYTITLFAGNAIGEGPSTRIVGDAGGADGAVSATES